MQLIYARTNALQRERQLYGNLHIAIGPERSFRRAAKGYVGRDYDVSVMSSIAGCAGAELRLESPSISLLRL